MSCIGSVNLPGRWWLEGGTSRPSHRLGRYLAASWKGWIWLSLMFRMTERSVVQSTSSPTMDCCVPSCTIAIMLTKPIFTAVMSSSKSWCDVQQVERRGWGVPSSLDFYVDHVGHDHDHDKADVKGTGQTSLCFQSAMCIDSFFTAGYSCHRDYSCTITLNMPSTLLRHGLAHTLVIKSSLIPRTWAVTWRSPLRKVSYPLPASELHPGIGWETTALHV